MFEFLFLDLDDTILDFHKAEHIALKKTLLEFYIDPTETACKLYSQINKAHWEALERKELTREQVLVGRFAVLFDALRVRADAEKCARSYEKNLSDGCYFLPGAKEAVERLSKKYKLYTATNGTKTVQAKRIQEADLSKYFRDIFISQDIGAEKPALEFFQKCFERIPGFDPKKAMIVGDSLTSDMQGGINAGIATCWVNPTGKEVQGIQPDYQIRSIVELEALLEML